MPRVAVGDVELYYETRGAGAPLLLVTGFGANSAIFQPEFVEHLARTFRVVTFDNRGTGRSDKPEGPEQTLTSLLRALLPTLGPSTRHIWAVLCSGQR